MIVDLIVALTAIILAGVAGTRVWAGRRQSMLIASRLSRWADRSAIATLPVNLLKAPGWSETTGRQFGNVTLQVDALHALLVQSGHDGKLAHFLTLSAGLLLVPPFLAFALGADLTVPTLAALCLAFLPFIMLKVKAGARRTKFSEQLPDAIDLMVSVLRSGHSIPQAVKSVAEELACPCGTEFDTILQRMNLGQPLAQALFYSAERFRSYELDLIRRAVAIQFEVGGSLAELLDKTNSTLRQRLKLVRQVRVITTQSRLTAMIVGLMPFVLAAVLNFISPGYLQPLTQEGIGRVMLMLAVTLQVVGLLILKRMSTMRT